MLPHPSAPFDTKSGPSPLAPFSPLVSARAQMDSADAPSTGGGADARAASGPSRVLLHVQVLHAGSAIVR